MTEKKKYGLIVIGGGMTGLSSALTWAINHDIKNDPVLLIEKNRKQEVTLLLMNVMVSYLIHVR